MMGREPRTDQVQRRDDLALLLTLWHRFKLSLLRPSDIAQCQQLTFYVATSLVDIWANQSVIFLVKFRHIIRDS